MISAKTLLHLDVEDSIRSVAFYQALLGAEPVHRSPTVTTFDLECPPLLLTLEAIAPDRRRRRREPRAHPIRAPASPPAPERPDLYARPRFTLVVNEPRHVGDAAIALRRAGIAIQIQDHGIAAHDPDRNAWQVRFVPSAAGRAVFESEGVPVPSGELRRP